MKRIAEIHRWAKDRTKLFRKRSAYRFSLFSKYVFAKKKKSPVFILASRRSGSNLLLSCLNSVPGLSFAPEALNQSMYYGLPRSVSGRGALRHIAHTVNACPERICGTKFVYGQLESRGIGLEALAEAFPSARFIVLYRSSLVEQFVSLKTAQKTGEWEWAGKRASNGLTVDRGELSTYVREMKGYYESIVRRAWLRRRAVFVRYEDLARDPGAVFRTTIFPFLGMPASPVRPGTRKQNIRPLSEVVENFEEVRSLLHSPSFRHDYSFAEPAAQIA